MRPRSNARGACARRLAAALLAALAAAACGPVPGGSLAGSVAPAPSDWTAAMDGEKSFCEVESRPADSHSIQLECFVHGDGLYVQSHRWVFSSWWPAESWAEIWIEHPDVRVRIRDALYELRAVHVTDATERDPILIGRGYDPVPDGIALFRFEPRG